MSSGAPKIDTTSIEKDLNSWLETNNYPLDKSYTVKMKEERIFEFVKEENAESHNFASEFTGNLDISKHDSDDTKSVVESMTSELMNPELNQTLSSSNKKTKRRKKRR